jgi:ComF family protein
MPAHLSNFGNALLDQWRSLARTASAARCLLCDDPAPARALCAACWTELPWLAAPCCEQCAQPLAVPGICGRCLADPPHFDAVAAACRYRFPVDGLIQSCKYGGRLATIRALAAMLDRCRPHRADLIVPMPLSPQRLRERGFNQALELARAVAPFINAPVDAGLCVKTRETPPQTRLPWKERRKNMRGAFVVLGDLSGRHVVVIDDVLTTGTTLSELAGNLKRAGAASVTGWVIARTVATGGAAA